MRILMGLMVLIAGLFGLAYYGATKSAPGIEAAVRAAVQDRLPAELAARVSGRDVVVSGLLPDAPTRDQLGAELSALDGVRVVDLTGTELYPLVEPFGMQAVRLDPSEAIALGGVVPSEPVRRALLAAAPGGIDGLSLAAGAPDGWDAAATLGVTALTDLLSGELALTGQSLSLRGIAATPDKAAQAQARLEALPTGFTADVRVEVQDDGTPLRLVLTRDGDLVTGEAKLPAGMDRSDLEGRVPLGDVDLTQSVLPAVPADWPRAAGLALDAVNRLTEAELNLTGQTLILTGAGTPKGIEDAAALIAGLPDGFTAQTDLSLWDDGGRLELTMEWDGETARATGKYPSDFIPRGPAGVAVEDEGRRSFLEDASGVFAANADAGVAALGLLDGGTLIATEARIVITGTATSPRVGEVMDEILAGAAEGTEIDRQLVFLDDGSPAAWQLFYLAADGARVEGRLPTTLSPQDLARSLGLKEVAGAPATAVDDASAGPATEVLGAVAGYLPEIEALTFLVDDGAAALDLILSPGVDLDLVAVDLAERLPPQVAFSLSPLDPLPEPGARRRNQATGTDEVFRDGFWFPDLEFTANAEGCSDQTQAVQAEAAIGFLPASARLDATSIRAVNRLATIAALCVAEGLTLEVGGHTDNTGDPNDNLQLSQARAEAVRDALIARGVPEAAIAAYGFGADQPVASNDTEEGRAANRRTDITWYAPGTPREP